METGIRFWRSARVSECANSRKKDVGVQMRSWTALTGCVAETEGLVRVDLRDDPLEGHGAVQHEPHRSPRRRRSYSSSLSRT